MENKTRQKNIGKYALIGIFLVVACGVGYGLYHGFTPEYEATHQYGPPQYVYDEATDTIRPYKEGDYYSPLIFEDEETGKIITEAEYRHKTKKTNYIIQGNKVVALTPLNPDQMKIQEEQGCTPCHPK